MLSNQNTKLFIHENASENIVWEKAAILCPGGDELMKCDMQQQNNHATPRDTPLTRHATPRRTAKNIIRMFGNIFVTYSCDVHAHVRSWG